MSSMPRLLLADRVKNRDESFLAPLIPALSQAYDVTFLSAGPGEILERKIRTTDIVWLEWCWDHAVWATRSGLLQGKPCVLRLHSIEALQTDYPGQVDWSSVSCLVTVGDDITDVLLTRFPQIGGQVRIEIIPNGIDLRRFAAGKPDRLHIAWVGHLEPKKNPMLLLQIAHRLKQRNSQYRISVAGACTDLRTGRYLRHMIPTLQLQNTIKFDGVVRDMPAWYADKGVLLSTTMYESFGMNIGEAMAAGAFPVIHDFPGADRLWPPECLFSSIEEALALIHIAEPGRYCDWVSERYALERQETAVLAVLARTASGQKFNSPISPARLSAEANQPARA